MDLAESLEELKEQNRKKKDVSTIESASLTPMITRPSTPDP